MSINSVAVNKTGILDSNINEVRLTSGGSSGAVDIIVTQSDYNNKMASSGIPFAYGAVYTTDELLLKNENGTEIAAQYDVLSYWPDNSFRSVLVTAYVNGSTTADKTYTLEYGQGIVQSVYSTSLSLTDNANDYTVKTGEIKVVIDKTSGSYIQSIHADVNDDESYSQSLATQIHHVVECAITNNVYSTQYATSPSITVARNGINLIEFETECRLKTSGGIEGPLFYQTIKIYKTNPTTEAIVETTIAVIDDETDAEGNTFNYVAGYNAQNYDVKQAYRRLEMELNVDSSMTTATLGGEAETTGTNLVAELDRASGDSLRVRQKGYRKLNTNKIFSSDPNVSPPDLTETQNKIASDGTGIYEEYSGALSGARCRGYAQLKNGDYSIAIVPFQFWEMYPQSIEANQNGLKYKMFDQVDSPTNEKRFYNDGGFTGQPQTLWAFQHGEAYSYKYRLVCGANVDVTGDTLGDMYFDWHDWTPRLQCTSEHYCATSFLFDMAPKTPDSTFYDDSYYYSRNVYPQRPESEGGSSLTNWHAYGWRDYGDRLYPGNFVSLGDVWYPCMYMGNHIGGYQYIAQWLRTKDYGWLKMGAIETYWSCRRFVAHCEVDKYGPHSLCPQPTPKGGYRVGNHATAAGYTTSMSNNHSHPSGYSAMWFLTGDLWIKRAHADRAGYLQYIFTHRYPLPRPASLGVKMGDPNGREQSSESRAHGFPMLTAIEHVKVTNDYDFYINAVCRVMQFWVEWWKAKEDLILNYEFVKVLDWETGDGYWPSSIPSGMDNAPSNWGNSTIPWTDQSMLNSAMFFYEMELQYQTGLFDMAELRMMMYQVMKHIVDYGWNDTGGYFVYAAIGLPPYGTSGRDTNCEHLLSGPMSKLLYLYNIDVQSGVLTPEQQSWFNPVLYKKIVDKIMETMKTEAITPISIPPYGYELNFPFNFHKYYPLIQDLDFS